MINYIWGGIILISLVAAMLGGRLDTTVSAGMEGATDAVKTCISLLGVLCLWTGLAKIAEKSGLTKVIARILAPIIKFLFPRLKAGSAAANAIVMNMVANLLGMGNAATPLGLNAMSELDKSNFGKGTATDEMCMFVVINTASIQLIPSTVIALRQAFGSANAGEIIVPTWISSICAVVVGVTFAKFFGRRR